MRTLLARVRAVRRRMPKKRYGEAHRALARWAADRAARVLPIFEKRRPKDRRPRRAIDLARVFARGEFEFSMKIVRAASLGAHAAARATADPAARAAARAAGQAVGTLHVFQHALAAEAYAQVAAEAHSASRSRREA